MIEVLSPIQRDRKQTSWCQGLLGGENGVLLFNSFRERKKLWELLHNNINIFNASKL